ncbi:SGNH/GDSL hydrolase family protein [Mucilaginibacter myungsuensis]|uniref:G-D-S-L family lipolytic protein n=1 Tax=Mucilaginibacter myungsuensis TaxID=649104 RepID=A0A929KSU4_9SPHI|nr:SGNH/GDSL hydrolase family protein [Mucilaginibacter myungsuensis]MBE9660894.1 G-D-S-L family lipolytic protein [Mucilaginibacter myungsuensis]MDN3600941.1 SGNH/GDSL hydrolase family protein [Mucilaginibacter myungsuensis]
MKPLIGPDGEAKGPPASGNNPQVDFSAYISIGDSQTAGHSNDGLYRDGQIGSFPNIIAQQLKAAGGGEFNQPLFDAAQANGTGYLKMNGFQPNGLPVIGRVTDKLAVRVTANGMTLLTKYSGNNNNFGITGIKMADIADANYGNKNPYYERLLPGTPPSNITAYRDFIIAKPYTFFTCWLGSNDLLEYAASGGTAAMPTNKATFYGLYTSLINKLVSNGQKGALANIVDVTYIPYFNTITVAGILADIRKVQPTANLFIRAKVNSSITDTTHTTRIATTADLLVLNFETTKVGQMVNTSAGLRPYGLSVDAPIEDKFVLDANEVAIVQDHLNDYNNTIATVANAHDLALFDVRGMSGLLKAGQTVDGVNISSAYITGGVFSLDGIHLTPRGYALEANEFIRAINQKYGTTIKTVNISAYAAVLP